MGGTVESRPEGGARTVLIVDDNAAVCRLLAHYFDDNGFVTRTAQTGTEMMTCLTTERCDLILLDLNLGPQNGLDLLRQLDARRPPVIVISARKHPVDKAIGIELGADDYVGKPFNLRELLARARRAMQRPRQPLAGELETIRFEGWSLIPERRQLIAPDATEVTLTGGEFHLLCVFVRHAGQVLGRDRLMDLVHGPGWNAFDRSIDAQVCRLRRKLEADGNGPRLIKSVRSAGYVFAAPVEGRRNMAA